MSDSTSGAEAWDLDVDRTKELLHELQGLATQLEHSEIPLVRRDAALIAAMTGQALELFEPM